MIRNLHFFLADIVGLASLVVIVPLVGFVDAARALSRAWRS